MKIFIILFLNIILIACQKNITGIYVSKNYENSIDTIIIKKNHEFSQKIYRIDGLPLYEYKGNWSIKREYLKTYIKFDNFNDNYYDKDFSEYTKQNYINANEDYDSTQIMGLATSIEKSFLTGKYLFYVNPDLNLYYEKIK